MHSIGGPDIGDMANEDSDSDKPSTVSSRNFRIAPLKEPGLPASTSPVWRGVTEAIGFRSCDLPLKATGCRKEE